MKIVHSRILTNLEWCMRNKFNIMRSIPEQHSLSTTSQKVDTFKTLPLCSIHDVFLLVRLSNLVPSEWKTMAAWYLCFEAFSKLISWSQHTQNAWTELDWITESEQCQEWAKPNVDFALKLHTNRLLIALILPSLLINKLSKDCWQLPARLQTQQFFCTLFNNFILLVVWC